MTAVQRKLVYNQFNSPIGLYSANNVKSTLNRELKAFSNGAMGVDCDDAAPANLANSAVLKFIQEEERQGQQGGVKRVTWPPEHEFQARASQTRQSPAFQPQQRQPSPFIQHQNGIYNQPQPQQQQQHQQQSHHYSQQQHPSQQAQYQQPSPVTNNNPNQSYHQQKSSQPNYQRQAPDRTQYPSVQQFNEPDPTYLRQELLSYVQSPPPKPTSCTAAFAGGISVANKPVAPGNRWSHVQPAKPVQSGYIQNQFNQSTLQFQQQSHHPTESAYANQYQPQQQSYPQQQQYQAPQQATQQYQAQPQQQPPQQQQYQPIDNFYRSPSPGVITLRKELPITQSRPIVYASEPAAYSYGGGTNMRGDNKWPPEEYKKQSDIKKEQRRQLALGPAFRPRRINKDYSSFFQRHALNATYPIYRAPPGTQHYGYQYPQ